MELFGKDRTYSALVDQIAALTVATNDLERNFRNLELDYLQTYDKVKRLMSRVAKRAAIDDRVPIDTVEVIDDRFSHLDPVSAKIMRRRANGVR